jgi:hypothetical protein
MEAQLHLLSDEPSAQAPAARRRPRTASSEWRLDERTRAQGRRGIAQARSALALAARHRAEARSEATAHADDQAERHPSAA